ncbi:MAG TPA: sigma-54 dependent transcriptional regulator [Casimicrobiaceae bacterium]|jgi:DNA-binding NtrC family response regulator|nr:sigma-54 dependent transcriptional regulator [Casimicrobiaceae bacterium]
MAQPQEILIVDDEVGIRELLSEILQDEGYRVSLAENAGEARSYRARSQPALVLLDIWMPDTDGVTLLREWAAGGQLTMPVVMMSGHGTIETAVEATKIGAVDFLEKPVGLQKLLATVTRALKTGAGQTPRRVSLAALGTSTPVIEAERAIEQLLRATRPILLVGESGTGHELAARAIHVPDTPFVALQNGSRLVSNPMQLLEDARDGLLYCGEIGGYSRAEQKGLAFLLPKLEKHNTILVCTSSEQLANLAADGRFDAALLASLSVGAVMLPPLRERREDIPALVDRYWREISASQRTQATMHDGAVSALAAAYWPGNLDHLHSVIANLALTVNSEITAEHVRRLLGDSALLPPAAVAPELTARFFELPLREAREAFERIYFEQLLGKEQSNMSRVAERAGLERTHLYRKLKQLNIRFSRRPDEGAC